MERFAGRGNGGCPVTEFVLSFDDGPSEWTLPILDLLDEHDRTAMFFLVGQQIAGREPIVEAIYRRGHIVGVHSWTHRRLTELSLAEVTVELAMTTAAIVEITDDSPTVFRAPYYATSPEVDEVAADLGLIHQGANVVPDDWSKVDGELIARIVLSEITEGCVVSLHDGIPPGGGSETCTQSRQPTVDAVRIILEAT